MSNPQGAAPQQPDPAPQQPAAQMTTHSTWVDEDMFAHVMTSRFNYAEHTARDMWADLVGNEETTQRLNSNGDVEIRVLNVFVG